MVFVCLYHQLISQLYMGSNGAKRAASTHKGKSAVVASADLGLVGVDKDSGMPGRAASTVAGHYLVVRPPYRLLVNELNGGIWFWLRGVLASLSDCTNSCSEQRNAPGGRSRFVRNAGRSLLASEVFGCVPRFRCG